MATLDEALALVKKLAKQLSSDRHALIDLNDYYVGKHPLAFASERFREAFGGMFGAFADNWCPLVVDSLRQRLHVEGFRFPAEEAEDPLAGDSEAWDIWQGNFLDNDSDIAHTDAMVMGRSYVTVGPPDPDSDVAALISVESPMDVIVQVSQDQRRRRLAALRVFTDDDGSNAATLYLPDQTWRFRQRGSSLSMGGTWELRGDGPERQPLGVVPVVPFINRPRLDPWGYSELVGVIPMQDAVNKLVADMMVASEFVALPQRFATGLEIQHDPVTNQPIDPFGAVARLWQTEQDNVTFGQFPNANLDTYVQAIELLIQHVASQSATPPHYFYLRGQFPSGESIKSAEAGLVAKALDRCRTFGESWEEVMRLAFKVSGDDAKAKAFNAETIWGDVEVRTESEHVDATQKKGALGIPEEQLWEDLGYTPQQIDRFRKLKDAQKPVQPPPLVIPGLAVAGPPNGAQNGAQPRPPGAVPALPRGNSAGA